MTISQLLHRDISQKIEPVVKVYDRESLAQDLEQFVITDSLAKELRKFLDAFAESLQTRIRGGRASDGIATWIYGFFGSGKSHVAKVLGHVLANDIVRHDPDRSSIDLFQAHLDDPTLPGAVELKALLQQIRNSACCLLVPFEIKSRQDQTNPDSVTEACLRSFYRTLGLAETPWVARLEHKLQLEGKYDRLCEVYREQNNRAWTEDRQEHGFYLSELKSALTVALDRSEEEAREMVEVYQRDHARITPEGLAEEVTEFLEAKEADVKPLHPHVVFVIDEMGQFIGDSENRIHELQSIIEQVGVIGRGRIWFICTSQEALEQVVDRTGLRLNQLGKLDARFSIKIPLTGEDVRRVVQNRLLRKREAQLPTLHSLYQKKEGLIEELCSLPIERHLAVIDRDSFAASYPFLPHTIPLVQELFNAMRGFKLSGTERSMIGVAQGALLDLASEPVGRLVPLDMVFDQQTEELSTSNYLGTTGMKLIREIDKQVPGLPIQPSRVLKALWLISKKTDWIPRTPESLAKLLADSLDVDTAQLRMQIKECLEALQRAGVVARDEATGQYRYLSEEERTLEEEIADEISRYGVGTAKRRATQLLKEQILTRADLDDFRIHLGKTHVPIPYSLELDGEPLRSDGELSVKIYSPLSKAKADDLRRENLAHGHRGKTLWWNAADDPNLLGTLKRLEALDKVPQKARWRTDRSNQAQAILREKQKERDGLQRHAIERLRNALSSGTVFYVGEETPLDGDKELSEIVQEFLEAVASHHYTQLGAADVRYDDANIPHYLRKDRSQLHQLDPELNLFDARGDLIRNSLPVESVFEELRRRQDEAEPLDGKSLVEHFARIPFGWPETLVRLVLAAMLRGGSVSAQPETADRPVYDVSDPRVDSLFTKTSQFRKTRFRALIGGLTPDEVKLAKERLIALGLSNLPDATQALADRVRDSGSELVEQSSRMNQRASDLGLPLPTPDTEVESVRQVLDENDPVARVRQFIEAVEEWKALQLLLGSYDQFAESGWDREFRSHEEVIEIVRGLPGLTEGLEREATRQALEEFDAIVEQRAILLKWKPLCEAARKVEEQLAAIYREKHNACVAAIDSLRRDVMELSAYSKLDEEQRDAILHPYFRLGGTLALPELADGDLSAAALVEAYRKASLTQMEALLKALPSYRREIITALEGAARDASSEEGGETARPVHRVHLHERLVGRRFLDKETFQKEWTRIGDEIAAKLDEDFEVVIDE